MATFPALQPSSRVFTPGVYPSTPFQALSGSVSNVRHGNVMLDSTLKLTFTGVTEAEMLSILAHYQGQRGNYESFALPTNIWSGLGTPGDFNLTNYRWCYTEPPSVVDWVCGGHVVELSFATVPPEGVSVNGLSGSIVIGFAAGTAVVSNGLNKTVTWTLLPGQAT